MRLNEYDIQLSAEELAHQQHRELVGGLWNDLGQLQFDFMRERGGLLPEMRMLDLGCGCFRGGIHFLRYLQAGNYYGIDVNQSLVEAGFTVELPHAGLASVLDRDHIRVTDNFDAAPFGVRFDRILAVSVWTHLPLNHIQRCLSAVSRVLAPDGVFFSSIFFCPPEKDLLAPVTHQPGGIVSYRDQDPYHSRLDDFDFLIHQARMPLRMEWIGDWEHPRNQQMLAFYHTGNV
jgi:SAM-dependent methyltransferase